MERLSGGAWPVRQTQTKDANQNNHKKEEGPWRKPPARQSPADGFIQREAEAFF